MRTSTGLSPRRIAVSTPPPTARATATPTIDHFARLLIGFLDAVNRARLAQRAADRALERGEVSVEVVPGVDQIGFGALVVAPGLRHVEEVVRAHAEPLLGQGQ